MKFKNIYLSLVMLLGVSLTSFGQETPPELPEMFNLTIKTSEMADNDCSPIVEDYLYKYAHSYSMTYGAYVKQTPLPSESFTLGVNTVTLELFKFIPWRPNELVDTETFTVTVIDDTSPTVTSHDFINNLYVDSGMCTATMPDLSGTNLGDYFDDNSTPCLGEMLYFVNQSPSVGSALPIGENTISITARDKAGNQATATTLIWVEDNEGPVMTRIPDLHIRNYDNQCYALMPDVSDHVRTNFVSDCSGQGEITQDIAIGTHIYGSNEITVTMADGLGNITKQKFNIVVFDNTAPIISLKQYPPFMLNTNNVMVNWFDIVNASDNCDERLLGTIVKENGETNGSYVSFNCCELGENSVTVTVSDHSGNQSTLTATVFIYDNVAPVITYNGPHRITLETTANTSDCEAEIPDLRSKIEGHVRDNCDDCSTANFTYVQKYSNDNGDTWMEWVEGTKIYSGDDNMVALFAEDNVKNLSEPVILGISIKDATGPVLVLNDITLELDDNGIAKMKFTDIYNREESSDNCSYIAESDSYWKGEWHDMDYYYEFSCSDMGVSFTQEFQVRDWAGNMSNVAITNITIVDKVAPELSTHDFTLNLDENGEFTVNPLDFVYHTTANGWGVTDNCTSFENIDLKFSQGTFENHPNADDSDSWFNSIDYTCAEIDEYFIWIKVTDESGNATIKRAMLYVEDNMNPINVGQDVVLQMSEDGLASLNVMQIENGSTDNCEIEHYAITKVDGHPTNMPDQLMGVQNYMFSMCYGNGHDEEYYAAAMASQSKKQDDCCGGLGVHQVEYTVIDKYNNSSSSIVNVTVLEHIIARALPVVRMGIPSDGLLHASDINNNSTDCLGDNIYSIYRVDNAEDEEPNATESLTLTCDDFMFDEEGNKIGLNVMLKVQENHPDGEVSYAASTVYFRDRVNPIAIALEELQITLDENNLATLSADDIDDGSYDNSGCTTKTIYLETEGQVMESGEINFTEDHIGQTFNVILRVVDKFGNEDYTNTVVSIYAGTSKLLSTEAMDIESFTVYPNPTTEMLFISNPDNTEMHVRLYNLTGKLVLEQHSFEAKVKLNVSSFDRGLYLVQIMSNNKLIVSKRIIKE